MRCTPVGSRVLVLAAASAALMAAQPAQASSVSDFWSSVASGAGSQVGGVVAGYALSALGLSGASQEDADLKEIEQLLTAIDSELAQLVNEVQALECLTAQDQTTLTNSIKNIQGLYDTYSNWVANSPDGSLLGAVGHRQRLLRPERDQDLAGRDDRSRQWGGCGARCHCGRDDPGGQHRCHLRMHPDHHQQLQRQQDRWAGPARLRRCLLLSGPAAHELLLWGPGAGGGAAVRSLPSASVPQPRRERMSVHRPVRDRGGIARPHRCDAIESRRHLRERGPRLAGRGRLHERAEHRGQDLRHDRDPADPGGRALHQRRGRQGLDRRRRLCQVARGFHQQRDRQRRQDPVDAVRDAA